MPTTTRKTASTNNKLPLLFFVFTAFVALMFTGGNQKKCFLTTVLAKPTTVTRVPTLDINLGNMDNRQEQFNPKNEISKDDVLSYGGYHRTAENNGNEEKQEERPELNSISSRDTFFALDPESKTHHRIETNSLQQQLWKSNKQQKNIGMNGIEGTTVTEERQQGELLQNGKSILTLATVDILNSTLSMRQVSNCRGDLFKHKVRVPGCLPKTIVNRFCHGSCSSFYIPRLRSKKLKATFQSCAACVPIETDLVKVHLNCPNRIEQDGELYRTIVRVKRCACRNIAIVFEDEEKDTATFESVDKDSGETVNQVKDTTSADDVMDDGIVVLNNER